MSDATARATPYPGKCPACGASTVVLLTLGDPEAPSETTTKDGITVMSHFQFLSCEACKHSWEPPKAAT